MDGMTTKELIRYLRKFPKDSEVKLLIIDTHQSEKLEFTKLEYCLVEKGKFPLIIADIDRRETMDITDEE